MFKIFCLQPSHLKDSQLYVKSWLTLSLNNLLTLLHCLLVWMAAAEKYEVSLIYSPFLWIGFPKRFFKKNLYCQYFDTYKSTYLYKMKLYKTHLCLRHRIMNTPETPLYQRMNLHLPMCSQASILLHFLQRHTLSSMFCLLFHGSFYNSHTHIFPSTGYLVYVFLCIIKRYSTARRLLGLEVFTQQSKIHPCCVQLQFSFLAAHLNVH